MKTGQIAIKPLAILALLGAMSFATTALAQPPGQKHNRLMGLEHRIERLDLDAETRTNVYTIIDKARVEQRDLRYRLRKAYGAMRDLLEQETPDEAAVLAQADTLGTLRTEHRKQFLRTLLAVRAQLTPEQRDSLRQSIHDRGGRKHRRRH